MPVTPRPRTLSAFALVAGLLALTACSSPDPAPPPSSAPPVFTNEEEALTAVTETYQEYMRISNTILVEGGVGVERIDAIVAANLTEEEHADLLDLPSMGLTLSGAPKLVTVDLQKWYPVPDAAGVLASATACMDLTTVQVQDSHGNSAVSTGRPATRTWSIKVGPGGQDQRPYVITSRDFLSEGAACAS
jgi:hypothetical protein